MSGLLAALFIVLVVVIARLAYRMEMNLFTFVIGFGTLIFCGMIVTGTVP